ncbi:MAG: prohead protease/major capsid protein fusion protein, partial [Bradyrhizobium sp.]
RALIRFPKAGIDAAADRMFALVTDKIIRNVSVGYSIDEVRVVEPTKEGEVEKRIITRWTPFEVSFVTIPADAGAQVRAAGETYAVIISRAAPEAKEAVTMDEEITTTTETRAAPVVVPATPSVAAPVVDEAATRAAVASERSRVSEITTLSVRHGMAADFTEKHIKDGTSLDEVRVAVLDAVAARHAKQPISGRVEVITDEGDTVRAAVENAIQHRANPGGVKLAPEAREWRGMSLMELGRTFHEQTTGERLRGLGKMELAGRLLGIDNGMGMRSGGMMSTSDFPNILANVISKRLRQAYDVAPQHWKRLSRQNNAPDFKERAVMQLSSLPQLKRITEGGEYTYAGMTDAKESYALATFGRIISVTRQTLINDDMGAFDRIPMLLGRAAAETEANVFWQIILTNPKMGDGVPLFDAKHNNIGAADGVNVTSLNVARVAMRKQASFPAPGEKPEPMNLTPALILSSPDKETEIQQFLATTLYPQLDAQVNPFKGSLEAIVEARLSGNAWYLFADPATIDTFEYAYLEGEEGLYTESRLGFHVDGIEIKGRLDFAAKAIDWRGMSMNPGNAAAK